MIETITVRDHIRHLQDVTDAAPFLLDLPILLAKDGEGNDFRDFEGDFDVMPGEEVGNPHLEKVVVFWPAW